MIQCLFAALLMLVIYSGVVHKCTTRGGLQSHRPSFRYQFPPLRNSGRINGSACGTKLKTTTARLSPTAPHRTCTKPNTALSATAKPRKNRSPTRSKKPCRCSDLVRTCGSVCTTDRNMLPRLAWSSESRQPVQKPRTLSPHKSVSPGVVMSYPTGVELHNGKIRITFTYRESRCREVLKGWIVNAANIKKPGISAP